MGLDRWREGQRVGDRRLGPLIDFGNARQFVCVGRAGFVTHLGLAPFTLEGSLFFAYEGSETVWDPANKGTACIQVYPVKPCFFSIKATFGLMREVQSYRFLNAAV